MSTQAAKAQQAKMLPSKRKDAFSPEEAGEAGETQLQVSPRRGG